MSEDEARKDAARAASGEEPEPAGDAASEGEAELEAARRQADEFKDLYLRTRAELENVRKRAARDVESARKFGIERFASELLGVRDSLEMGLAAAEEPGAALDKLKEGMDLTARMLAQAMEKFGVEPLDPEGEPFNPEYHEAMTTQESAEHEPNTVVNVIQKGYLLNGRVIRPAMVVVSRAPESGEAGDEG